MIDKAFRLLQMYERLSMGETITKAAALNQFAIPPKTFQRDIDSLRLYYMDKVAGSYYMTAKTAAIT